MHSAIALAALLIAGAPSSPEAPPAPPAPPAAPAAPLPAAPEIKPPAFLPDSAESAAPKAPPAAEAAAKAPAEKPDEKAAAEGEAAHASGAQARKTLPVKATGEVAAPPARTYPIIPPALSSRALLDELRRTSRDRQAESAGMALRAQQLQALQQEVDRSRAALREETTRLQSLVASGGSSRSGQRAGAGKGPGPGGARPGEKPEPTPLETLARTARGMKPDQAAAMMTHLDRGLAAAILTHMKPADAALVLEKMEPATSASLVALLARKDRT